MAGKILYVAKVGLEVEVDPGKPKTVEEAGQWLAKVIAGDVIKPPEGMKLKVVEISAPDIVRRREEK